MEFKTLPGGDRIPVLGLGTWQVGGGMSADHANDKQEIEGIRTAVELGYRHIDTAEIYGGGHAEELVRLGINGFSRTNLFITSKVWSANLGYRATLQALEGSLRRLDMPYLDMYLIHWPNHKIPLEETFAALNELVEQGKVRHVGVSNFDKEQLAQAMTLSKTPLSTNQVHYSLLYREPEQNGVLRFCRDNNILLTAYRPLERGAVLAHSVVREIAGKHGVTPAQVALKWLIDKPNVITIAKAVSESHLKDNMAALSVQFSEEDVARLDSLAQ